MTLAILSIGCPECCSTVSAVRSAPNQLLILRHQAVHPLDSAHHGNLPLENCPASGCFLFEPTAPQDIKPPLEPAQQAAVIRKRRMRAER